MTTLSSERPRLNHQLTSKVKNSNGTFEIAAAMILSGTIGVFVQESGLDAMNVVFFRCLFGMLFLGAYAIFRGYLQLNHLNGRDWQLILLGGVAIVFNWFFLFEAFQYSGIGMTTVVYHTQPFFVLLISAMFFKERFSAANIGWVVIAFLGITLIVNPLESAQFGADFIMGIGLSLIAALLYAIATITAKRLKHIKPHMIVVLQLALGTFLLLPFTTLENVPGVGDHWYRLLGLGVIHTCVMYVLMYSGFQKASTQSIAVLSYIYPVVALIVDYAVYGHAISPLQLIGIFLILYAGFAMNNPKNPIQNWWRIAASKNEVLKH